MKHLRDVYPWSSQRKVYVADELRRMRSATMRYCLAVTRPTVVYMPDVIHNRGNVWSSYIVLPQEKRTG